MRIFIDGQQIPVNVRVTRDILLTLKSMVKTLRWQITYDTVKEVVQIYTKKSSSDKSADRPVPEIIEPQSNRLLGKVICLDPGHGGSDPGATGPTGTLEKDNTLAISLLLRDMLEGNGATVILTRDSDRDVSYPDASASEELGARVDIANDSMADIFISVHNDSFTSNGTSGATTFHYGDSESIRLGTFVQSRLVAELGTKDRGIRFASFYVIRYTTMPAILAEVAFISNPEEELLLNSEDGRRKAAESIFEGVVNYFKV